MATAPMSKVPLFGRAWELIITLPANDAGDSDSVTITSSAWEPEALRMVFEVNLPAYETRSSYWYAKIDIYNLNPMSAAQLIDAQGAIVKLSAGYQTGSGRSGVIFQGEVYQVMFERVDVVDSKITIMAYTGLRQVMANPVSLRGNRNMTQLALIQKICAAASTPITIGTIDPAAQAVLSQTMQSRARPVFGDPHDFIDDVVSANQMVSWYGFDGLGISRLAAASATPEITYDGSSGQIIGTPQQTLLGLSMNVLLDPNLKVAAPPQVIQLINSQLNQMSYQIPAKAPILSPNGTYLVIGLQHNGDTKGEMWRTEIVALLNGNAQYAAIMAAAGPASQGKQQTLDPRSPR